MRTLLCFVVAATLAMAADVDVTGKWSGSFNVTAANGETKESTAVLVLKQDGAGITGTAGPDENEQHPIRKGKIEGDKITLELDNDGHTINFDLVLTAGRITGEANGSRDGQALKAKVDVGRVK
jgi:hypothetical protein